MLHVRNPSYKPHNMHYATEQTQNIDAVFTDVDDILLDWCGAFMKWYSRAAPDIKTLADLFKEFPKGKISRTLVYEYQDTPDYRYLPLLPYSQQVMANFAQAGKPVIAITSCGKHYVETRSKQLFDIRNFNTNISGVYMLDHGETKATAFEAAFEDYNLDPKRVAFIDDMHGNCVSAVDTGIGCVAWQPMEHRDDVEDLPAGYRQNIHIVRDLNEFEGLVHGV